MVTLAEHNILQLPEALLGDLHPGAQFLAMRIGGTILFKCIHPPRITDSVANTPETESPLTLEEINGIVHEVRRGL